MSRELLQRCLNRFIRVGYEGTLVDDLENYLAQPEVKRERLSEEEIDRELIKNDYYSRSFTAGVRFAEKHHRIEKLK